MVRRLRRLGLTLAAGVMLCLGSAASAVPVMTSDAPAGGWDLTARARNGRSGFEIALQDPAVVSRNAPGAPAWSFGNPHAFELQYVADTGALTFRVDFSRNGSFDAGETLSNTFTAYAGRGFGTIGLVLQGNAIGNTQVNALTINGTSFGSFGFTANSMIEQNFTDTSGMFRDILITGNLIFSANGGTDERPRIGLRLGNDMAAPISSEDSVDVPAPAALGLFALGLAAIGATRLRRRPR